MKRGGNSRCRLALSSQIQHTRFGKPNHFRQSTLDVTNQKAKERIKPPKCSSEPLVSSLLLWVLWCYLPWRINTTQTQPSSSTPKAQSTFTKPPTTPTPSSAPSPVSIPKPLNSTIAVAMPSLATSLARFVLSSPLIPTQPNPFLDIQHFLLSPETWEDSHPLFQIFGQ
jgi:hypothetical protein